jgi:hypothetical protein
MLKWRERTRGGGGPTRDGEKWEGSRPGGRQHVRTCYRAARTRRRWSGAVSSTRRGAEEGGIEKWARAVGGDQRMGLVGAAARGNGRLTGESRMV